jgi:hypothetical protein
VTFPQWWQKTDTGYRHEVISGRWLTLTWRSGHRNTENGAVRTNESGGKGRCSLNGKAVSLTPDGTSAALKGTALSPSRPMSNWCIEKKTGHLTERSALNRAAGSLWLDFRWIQDLSNLPQQRLHGKGFLQKRELSSQGATLCDGVFGISR